MKAGENQVAHFDKCLQHLRSIFKQPYKVGLRVFASLLKFHPTLTKVLSKICQYLEKFKIVLKNKQ